MRPPSIPPHDFSLRRIEERWIVDEGRPRLLELRAEAGQTRLDPGDPVYRQESLSFFPRSDSFGGARDRVFSALLDALPPAARFSVRRVALFRTAAANGAAALSSESSFCTLRGEGGTLVLPLTSDAPDRLFEALDLLESGADSMRADPHDLPIAWLGGTAAVLAHEAAGHPAEGGAPPLQWPAWVTILDDPRHDGLGTMEFDDTGQPTAAAVLSRGERPSTLRRESYRDEPLLRMTNLIVSVGTAELALPDPRIEVHLLGGGRWDPATDIVTIRVLRARRVDGRTGRSLPPFVWRAPRALIPSLLIGGGGPSVPYPGVLCADEGQRIPVGSFAPVIVTKALPQ